MSAGLGDVDRFDRWLSNEDLGVTSEGRIRREEGRGSELTVVFFVELPPSILKGGKVSALDPPFSGVDFFSVSALLASLSLRHGLLPGPVDSKPLLCKLGCDGDAGDKE